MTLDNHLVDSLRNDYHNAPLSDAERVMCDYSIRLTEDPVSIGPDHHEALREAGFDGTAILQITIIAAWFNYINRVADALGVGRANES